MNDLVCASEVVNQKSLSPKQLTGLANIIASSRMFKDAADASKAAIKVLAGHELGVGPVNSMMGIYFVRERLSYSANFMACVVQKSDAPGNPHRFRYQVKRLDNKECVLEFFKRDEDGTWLDLGPSSFTMEDAKEAALGGDNWKKYKRNMLFARAMSNGCRWYCPALFGGSAPYSPDELDDTARIDDEGNWKFTAEVASAVIDLPETREGKIKEVKDLLHQTETEEARFFEYFARASVEEFDEDQLRTAILKLRTKLPV